MLEVDFDVLVNGKKFEMRLVYPDFFPDTPAFVRPRDASIRVSNHQYGVGGVLCLEQRPETWDPAMTGVDLIRSTYTLLSAESAESQQVQNAHRASVGQGLRLQFARFLLTRNVQETIASFQSLNGVAFRTKALLHENCQVVFATHLQKQDGTVRAFSDCPAEDHSYWPLYALNGRARAFDVGKIGPVESIDVLTKAVGCDSSFEALFPTSSEEKTPVHQYFVFLRLPNSKLRVLRVDKEPPHGISECSIIDHAPFHERLPMEYRTLSGKSAAIIGVGSVGSKVAVSLARSGVRRFLLIDDDVLLPENLRRNELSWIGVGAHKVDAVREAVHFAAPGSEVVVRRLQIAGQENSSLAASMLEEIAGCDLIIDATADDSVFLLLAAIAKRGATPLCWAELFAGGVGGLLARSRPGVDPNPLDVRNAINNALSLLPPAPYQRAVDYDVDRIRPLVAYDADVTVISALLSRFAIDTLVDPSGKMFPYSAYMIGLRKQWVFSQPLDVIPIEVGAAKAHEDTPVDDAATAAAIEFLASFAGEEK